MPADFCISAKGMLKHIYFAIVRMQFDSNARRAYNIVQRTYIAIQGQGYGATKFFLDLGSVDCHF